MDTITFVKNMKTGDGHLPDFVVLVNQGSELYVNRKLRDFMDYWDIYTPPTPEEEFISEDNQDLLDRINAELPEDYHIDYAPDDPGSIYIAKQIWWEGINEYGSN